MEGKPGADWKTGLRLNALDKKLGAGLRKRRGTGEVSALDMGDRDMGRQREMGRHRERCSERDKERNKERKRDIETKKETDTGRRIWKDREI